MGKIITIASQKGGVGKTTTALNLGYSLSRFGAKVLVLDGDPQGGISLASNLKKRTSSGVVQVLKGESSIEDVIQYTRDNALSICGIGASSHDDVSLIEEESKSGRLAELTRKLADNFEYLLVDAPAGVGGIVTSFLSASDSTILVLRCQPLAVKSMPSFLKLVKWVAVNQNPGLKLEGLLLTMMDGSATELQLYPELKNSLPEKIFFKSQIPFNDFYDKATLYAVPVAMMPGGQEANRPYMDLAIELRERELNLTRESEDGEVQGLF